MRSHPIDVFISYRREDGAEFAEGLSNTLNKLGYSVFFDKKSLRGGDDFPSDIKKSVQNAKEIILIITPSYFGKNADGTLRINQEEDWVRKEVELSLENVEANIFPITIDCPIPAKNALPESIKRVLNKNVIRYDRSFDTYDSIAQKLISGFNDETRENALIGNIKSGLSKVEVHDTRQFNIACKNIIGLIKREKDVNALLHFLTYVKPNGKRLFYKKDDRFIVFYTLFTYFRRMHQAKRLIALVDMYGKDFSNYPFFNYVMTEYHFEMFNLSQSAASEREHLTSAINFAHKGITKLGNNNGIQHAFTLAIVLALENSISVNSRDIDDALRYINQIIERDPNYGGLYYSTRARLLGCIGLYDETLKNIRYAQTLERPTHDDWILRVAGYQKYEILIRLRAAGLSGESLSSLSTEEQ